MKSDRRLAALTAICETFLPVSASDSPSVAVRILDLIGGAKVEDRIQFE